MKKVREEKSVISENTKIDALREKYKNGVPQDAVEGAAEKFLHFYLGVTDE